MSDATNQPEAAKPADQAATGATDLSLATMDELLQEIDRRTDTMVFGYLIRRSASNENIALSYSGSLSTAIGLASQLNTKLRRMATHLQEGG